MMDALSSETLRSETWAAPAPAASAEFERVVRIFRRHLRLFAAVGLAVFALVAIFGLTRTPRYMATATVLIHQHTPDVLHLNALTPQDAEEQAIAADSSAVDTQVEILRSRALASGVVDQLHLDQDPEFGGGAQAAAKPGGLRGLLGGKASDANDDPALIKQRQHENIVNAVMAGLLVKRTGLTYTIDISFTALEPAKATLIANAFAQRYLTEGLDSKFDATSTATSWLDGRLAQLRQEAQTADAAVEQYKIANNLLSAQGATLTEEEISTIDTQLAQAKAAEAEQNARLHTAQNQLAAGSNGGDVGEAMNNPVIQSLRAQDAQISTQLADLQARYGDKYPDIIKAKRAKADLDAQIQTEIQRVLSNLKAQSEVARTRTASLAATAGESRSTLAGNNKAMVRLNELQSNAAAADAIYTAFLTRYKETIAKEGVQASDARVVSEAKLPTSAKSPNKRLDIAIALALGIASGAGSILLAELLKQGISSASEVEDAFDLPSLGEVPTLVSTLEGRQKSGRRPNPVDYVVEKPLSHFAESFRNLRASLVSSRTGVGVKVIAITSSVPGEGKTTTALCLARTMALSGSRVMLVDCDLRQRSISRALPVEPAVGLMEVLNGTATLDEALVRDSLTGMMVLPLAKSAFTPRDVFGSEPMARLLEELRTRLDFVVLDTAPALALADTRILCPQADVTMLVVRWRKTARKAVLSALRALNPDDTFVAGIALTQVNVREQVRVGEGEALYYRSYRKYYMD